MPAFSSLSLSWAPVVAATFLTNPALASEAADVGAAADQGDSIVAALGGHAGAPAASNRLISPRYVGSF